MPRLAPLCALAVALVGCAASGRAADGSADGPERAGFALAVEADLPASVARGGVLAVRAAVRNDGAAPATLEFGEDAVRLRATAWRAGMPGDLDDVPSGVFWVREDVTAQAEVIAILYRTTVAPGNRADLPALDVPVTLAPGTYTVRVCAALAAAPTGEDGEWCTPGARLAVE